MMAVDSSAFRAHSAKARFANSTSGDLNSETSSESVGHKECRLPHEEQALDIGLTRERRLPSSLWEDALDEVGVRSVGSQCE